MPHASKSKAGIHLIAITPCKNKNAHTPLRPPMLPLELCERPAVADAAEEMVAGQPPLAEEKRPVCPWWQPLLRRSLLGRSTRRLIVLLLIVLFLRTFIGEASVVPTASMEGTILVGDHLFMNKLFYGPEIPLIHWRLPMLKTIHRGEIVVFHYPKNPSELFLKRVAAVGGDQVDIREGVLYVNSHLVAEPYAIHHGPAHSAHEGMGALVVPKNQLFVMGDNRDNSSDSRDWGFVPVHNVIGEPLFVYWSYDAPSSRWLDENLGHRIGFYASIAGNFFSRTRWKRTGMWLGRSSY